MFNNSHRFPDFHYFNPVLALPVVAGHEWVVSEKYVWDNVRHSADADDYGFFQYTLSGMGLIRFQEREHRLEAGTGFFCLKSHAYRYWFDKKAADHWEFMWLGIRGQVGLALIASIQKEFGKVVSLPLQGMAANMLRELHRKTGKGEWKNQMQVSTALYQFLLQVIEDLRNRGTQDSQERLDQALSYIRDHFAEPLDISILSPRFGYTREHFIRLFRKKTGITPGKYIQTLRINRVKEMLRTTRLSLDSIAMEAGFRSANYLCRLFNQVVGMTPREYQASPDAAIGR